MFSGLDRAEVLAVGDDYRLVLNSTEECRTTHGVNFARAQEIDLLSLAWWMNSIRGMFSFAAY